MSRIILTSKTVKNALSQALNCSIDSFDQGIDEEQINRINHLTLDDFDGIEELNYFQHLKSLEFTKDPYDSNNVMTNLVILPHLPELKQLNVSNMIGLETLNIHNLDTLSNVLIKNNTTLKRIVGLEKLHSLSQLVLINNDLKDLNELKNVILNKSDVKIYLDIHYLPYFYDEKVKKEISSYPTLKWVESGMFTKDILIDFEKGIRLYDELKLLSEKFSLSKITDIRQIRDVYYWMCNEYAYDTQLHIKRSITNSGNKIIQQKSDDHEFNSAFFLLQNHYSGTDGIINFLVMLLRMNGFNAIKVLCCIPNDYNRKFLFEKGYTSRSQCNHLILKVQANDGWLYLDPVIDSIYPEDSMRKVLQTKQEITKDYFLIDSERSTHSSNSVTWEQKENLYQKPKEKVAEPKELPLETTLLTSPSTYSYVKKFDGSQKQEITSTPFTLGRLPDNDYVIENSNVGRYHCRIIEINNTYFVEDLNSLNGTFVNHIRLLPNKKTVIRNKDIIEMADEKIMFIQEAGDDV